MEQSTMQHIKLSNIEIIRGQEQAEQRFCEMRERLETQVKELKQRERDMLSDRKKAVLTQARSILAEAYDLKEGDCFEVGGYIRPFLRMDRGYCNIDDVSCDDRSWLAIPSNERPGYSPRYYPYDSDHYRKGYKTSGISAVFDGYAHTLDELVFWCDNGEMSKALELSQLDRLPPRSSLPAGSHYPLHANITAAMQSAKVRLSEEAREYSIHIQYADSSRGRMKSHLPVVSLRIDMPQHMCSDLRKVANHQNQYNKLLAVFDKRGWLEFHEYKIEVYPETYYRPGSSEEIPHPNAGQVKMRSIVFKFKMIIPTAKENANDNE